MALLTARKVNNTRYEVRSAGRARRLYTDGAFHTQYHPAHLFTGAVWDLLSLPVLGLPSSPRRILVLGVAGGTVIHQFAKMTDATEIVGIELDAVHIELGRDYFDLSYPFLEVIQADARTWIEHNSASFDCIVDDVFIHGEHDPARPFASDAAWMQQLTDSLSPSGLLIQNHIAIADARDAAKHLKGGSLLTFETAMYENCVIAWYRNGTSTQQTRATLNASLAAMPKQVTRRLRHRCRAMTAR